MPFIVVDKLSHIRESGSHDSAAVLRDVSFRIREGEYVAVIGNNGSGKTTLIRHLNGLLLPTGGDVLVDGMNTRNRKELPAIRTLIGMVFQSPFDQMVGLTVESEAAFGPENHGLPEKEIDERVEAVLRKTGIWEERQRSPLTLSAGQQQRLAIAGALAMNPRCLVLDEATSMLDPRGRTELYELIGMLRRDGLTVVSVTNHIEEAATADRILVLRDGTLILDGTPEAVFADPAYAAAGLEPPRAGAVAAGIRKALPRFPGNVYTVERLSDAVAAALNGGQTERHERPAPGKRLGERVPDEDAAGPVVRVRNLSFSYLRGTPAEKRALSGVDLTVYRGECVALVGGTGSGKSTLLRHLNGLNRLQEGSVEVLGMDLADPKYDFRKLRFSAGLAFQRPEEQLFEYYLGEDVAFGPVKLGLSGRSLKERVRYAMETAGLDYEKFKYRPTEALSGGEKRRGGLAGVIALEPEIYLLDEPAAGLDPAGRSRLIRTIRELKNGGRTVVFVSHSLEDVAELAERVYVLENGRVVLEGTTKAVLTNGDALRSAGLEAPFPLALAAALRSRGIDGMRTDVLTVEETADALLDLLERTRV